METDTEPTTHERITALELRIERRFDELHAVLERRERWWLVLLKSAFDALHRAVGVWFGDMQKVMKEGKTDNL